MGSFPLAGEGRLCPAIVLVLVLVIVIVIASTHRWAGSSSLEDDYDYDYDYEDEAAFSGLGWAGELFDESWFSKVCYIRTV